MNTIIKKLAQRKSEIGVSGSGHSQHNYHYQPILAAPVGTFDETKNNRYSGVSSSHNQHQQQMSFAGKKITQVSNQVDTTKRMSVNLHSGFINKI